MFEQKCRIEKLEVEKYEGAAMRARAEKLLFGEQPAKRALADRKVNVCNLDIRQMECGGVVAQSDITTASTEYHRKFFRRKNFNK